MSAFLLRHRPAGAVAVAAALALALPAVGSAATVGNPQVLRFNPAVSSAMTVIGGGSPWNDLGGPAVDAANTLYVPDQGLQGPASGDGVYSLAAANAVTQPAMFTPLATAAPTSTPQSVVLNGSMLYSLDGDKIVSMTTTAPAVQTVLSSGQLYDSLGVQPEFGAMSGTTLYTAATGPCDSVAGGGGFVIAVDTTTGVQKQIANLGVCAALGGIAVEQAGTLLVVETNSNTESRKGKPQIVRVNPATGSSTVLSSGKTKNLLKTPQGVYYGGPSTLYVADTTAGIIQVNPTTGHQFSVAKPGGTSPLGDAYGIVRGADGSVYVTEAGVPPTMRATAPGKQKPSSSGIVSTAACNRACTVNYDLSINTVPSYSQTGAFKAVSTKKKTLAIKIGSINNRINSALKKGKKVTGTIVLTPVDPDSGSPGKNTKLVVTFVR
jgi:hypothetical protein